jgi:glycosyltransferase involved in cell wall biosynthesis
MSSLAVVIPTHNRAHLVQRAVDSVRSLAEVIVVDDGSIDETPLLASAFRAQGVRYERLEQSRGPGYARNLGVAHATADLVLFLDDDDVLLPAGSERIRAVADRFPDEALFLHNCAYPDGHPSVAVFDEPRKTPYAEWLARYVNTELKPVARRTVFDRHEFVDTGASGEGLLWGRVIREFGAVVSGLPVVLYDVESEGRLTSPRVLLERADANARIAERWIDEFGEDLWLHARPRWVAAVRALVTYSILADRRDTARRALVRLGARISTHELFLLRTLTNLPRSVVMRLFLMQRREWRLATARRPLE